MKYGIINIIFLLTVVLASQLLVAQTPVVYTIKADSVKITNCDSSELILENHTQAVPGFLFNTGNGRTIFKRGMQAIGGGSYVFGADTLKLAATAWLQGGNSFGATGVLGTLDNHHLDFYTSDTARARLTARGRFLIGTTTDDSMHLLQVHGTSTFSGDMNIGSATITNAGNLIGTNAALFNQLIPETEYYWGDGLYVSKLDNILYDYQNRMNTTQTIDPDGTIHINIQFPGTVIDSPAYVGLTYDQGSMFFSFYPGAVPASISVLLRDSMAHAWRGPLTTSTNLSVSGAGFFRIDVPQYSYLSGLQITINPTPGVGIFLRNIEYATQRETEGLQNAFPYVSKIRDEHMYGSLRLSSGRQDNTLLSPQFASWFKNNLLIGTSTDNGVVADKLQVAGNIVATGQIGIGTTTPSHNLEVVGDAEISGISIMESSAYLGGTTNFVNSVLMDLNDGAGQVNFPGNGSMGLSTGTHSSGPVRRLTIDTLGNVGIGTGAPSAQLHTTGSVRFAGLTLDSTQTRVLVSDASGNLHYRSASSLAIDEPLRSSLAVNGPITAKQLRLHPDGWADYVFDSSYRLPSLQAIASYIRENHHLPGIITAAEVRKDGIDVGQTQTAMLKKIEELTLYTIEQDKKLTQQQQAMDSLKTRIEKLEQLLETNTKMEN